ncbi:tetratricopeptide repeat protein 1-like [Hyperolius riggenbachi]|uniref:tetratricopeptide repeat protein 1-like n=1 Tax=Hyperolius riggenbachi TaxID=752182 RepID=UPI0035A27E18
MAAPEVERSVSGKDEEDEENFHDCPEEPGRQNGESEEEFTILEEEPDEESAPVLTEKGGDPEPVTMEKGGPEPVTMEKGGPEPVTMEKGGPEPVTMEKGGPEPVTTEKGESCCGEELTEEEVEELDEEELLEMEKDMTEEEREDRRKESAHSKEEGNELFKKGDYAVAETIYTQALQKCPAFFKKDRSILFSNRAAARAKQNKNDLALKDCTKAIELNPDYIRALLRRAELYEKTEKLDEALADYKSVMEKDMSCRQAREACLRLPKQIEERNEKMKEEMIGKLKDLGNLVLKPFGLSTANFQVNQDSQTGSYSINFVQNHGNR